MEYFSKFAPRNNPSSTPMKAVTLSVTALATLFLVACGPNEAEMAAAKEKATADSLAALAATEMTYRVDAAASTINWKGTMLGVKSHHGTVNLTEGKLAVKGGQILAGGFNVDLSSMAPLDSAYAPEGSKQGTKTMLIGHLQSADFFDVANFPNASFEITSVEGNTATGNLTVRGKTNEEKVTDIVVTEENGTVKVTGKLAFDRQKYGVAWSSGSKDAILNDNIELEIALTASAQ
jgi:polyisoprenoid-binding protein YceI